MVKVIQRVSRVVVLMVLALTLGINVSHAQEFVLYVGDQFAFLHPADWQIQHIGAATYAGRPADIDHLLRDEMPDALSLRIVSGTSAVFKVSPQNTPQDVLTTLATSGEAKKVEENTLAAKASEIASLPQGFGAAIHISDDRWLTVQGYGKAISQADFTALLKQFVFTVVPISYNTSIKYKFSSTSASYLLHFDGKKGDVITLSIAATDKTSNLDSVLTLYGIDGTVVARNDDSQDDQFGFLNARISRYPLPATGSYAILATRNGTTDGEFTLELHANKVVK